MIGASLLEATISGLRGRSAGWRESGAIWVGHIKGAVSIVTEVRFYHNLCNDKGRAFSLQLTEEAKFALYQDLAERGLKLVGMIHTHPGAWVDLSSVDKANQLCSRIGFWSLVVPHYARHSWNIKTIGVHIRIDSGWHWFSTKEARNRISIR